jgi:hypothetical protein
MENKRYLHIRQRNQRMRWWGLKGEKQDVLKDKIIKESKWNLDKNIDN